MADADDKLASGNSLLSDDSEPPIQDLKGTSTELERLLEDSVDIDSPLLPDLQPPADTFAVQTPRAAESSTPASSSPSPSPIVVKSDTARVAAPLTQPSAPAILSEAPRMSKSVDTMTVAEDISLEPWAKAQLSVRLEDICRDLRRSVEHEFLLAERAIQNKHQSDLDTQHIKAETIACQQQARIDGLTIEVQQLSKRLEITQRRLKESSSLTHRVRTNLKSRSAFELAFRSWRAAAIESKDGRLQLRIAGKVNSQSLLGHYFGSWRYWVQSSWKDRIISHERAAADLVRTKLFEQMETERSELQLEAEKLRIQLAEEARQRALLQENLKRVFMRGVCALNFEAMSLLSDPSGAALTGQSFQLEASVKPSLDTVNHLGNQPQLPQQNSTFDWSQLGNVSSPAVAPSSFPPESSEHAAQISSTETLPRPVPVPSIEPDATTQDEDKLLTEAGPIPIKTLCSRPRIASEKAQASTPAPLPFVSYNGPAPTVLKITAGRQPTSKGSSVRSASASSLRHSRNSALAVASSALPRREVVTAGG